MPQTTTFDAFVADALSGMLPFRKRGFLGRQQECEYGPVQVVDERAFFMGAALSLASRDDAEVTLTNLINTAWIDEANALDQVFVEAQRLSARSEGAVQRLFSSNVIAAFDSNFLQRGRALQNRDLLSSDDCQAVIRSWVTYGTIFGWVLPKTTAGMIRTRLRTPTIANPSGIEDQRLSTSFANGLEEARNMATEWDGTDPDPAIRFTSPSRSAWRTSQQTQPTSPRGGTLSNDMGKRP